MGKAQIMRTSPLLFCVGTEGDLKNPRRILHVTSMWQQQVTNHVVLRKASLKCQGGNWTQLSGNG